MKVARTTLTSKPVCMDTNTKQALTNFGSWAQSIWSEPNGGGGSSTRVHMSAFISFILGVGLRNPPVASLTHHRFMLHASPSPKAALPQTVIHTQSICSGRRPSKARTVNDSTVGEAWKEYVFSVREDVSALLGTASPTCSWLKRQYGFEVAPESKDGTESACHE